MVDFLLANSTDAQVSNVNVGGIDIPKRSVRTATMTAAELLAYCQLAGQSAMLVTSTNKQKREVARVLKYRKSATGAAL